MIKKEKDAPLEADEKQLSKAGDALAEGRLTYWLRNLMRPTPGQPAPIDMTVQGDIVKQMRTAMKLVQNDVREMAGIDPKSKNRISLIETRHSRFSRKEAELFLREYIVRFANNEKYDPALVEQLAKSVGLDVESLTMQEHLPVADDETPATDKHKRARPQDKSKGRTR